MGQGGRPPRRGKRPGLGDPQALTLFPAPNPRLTERQWQYVIQRALDKEHYRWNHVYRMQSAKGRWMTSTTAVGWPDIVALRPPYIIAIECKGVTTPIEPAQYPWLVTFSELPTGRAWVLRPQDDWQRIANWLHDPETAPRIAGWRPELASVQRRPTRRGA
jgi:hypothetical protein